MIESPDHIEVQDKISQKTKEFTRKEVIQHNHEQSCWVIIENEVFDLTSFIQRHPGGKDIILSRAGEDASSFFMMKHGDNKQVKKQLANYRLGQLVAHEQIPAEAFQEPFIEELNKEIREKNLFQISASVKRKFFIIRSSFLLLFFLAHIGAIYFSPYNWLSIVLIVFQALIGVSLFGLIAHESTHRNFPKNRMLNSLLTVVWPMIWPFISRKPLIYEHNSHHIKIGDEEYDFEVAGFSKLIKYSSQVESASAHKKQHRLAMFWYPFYANIITTIGGITSKFWSSHNRTVALYHSLSVIASLSYYIFIPAIILGFSWKFFLFYLLYQSVLFTGIYVGAAINHFIPASLNEMKADMANKYGYYICHHTSNFGADMPFWFWFTGGFNVQIEHHLSPFVPVENLRELIPIVKQLCQKYNYPYIDYKGVKALWQEHYDFLEILSREEDFSAELKNKERYQAR